MIARKTYLLVAGLLIVLAASAPVEVEAQDGGGGLTCGWCVHGIHGGVRVPGGIEGVLKHIFPYGGNGCGWEGHDLLFAECSRCGGPDSHCHTQWWDGYCHILCGPEGDAMAALTAALTEIEEALGAEDIALAASALRRERTGVSVEFSPGAGRIDLMLPCEPDRVYHTIPVLPEVRTRLQAELQASAS